MNALGKFYGIILVGIVLGVAIYAYTGSIFISATSVYIAFFCGFFLNALGTDDIHSLNTMTSLLCVMLTALTVAIGVAGEKGTFVFGIAFTLVFLAATLDAVRVPTNAVY